MPTRRWANAERRAAYFDAVARNSCAEVAASREGHRSNTFFRVACRLSSLRKAGEPIDPEILIPAGLDVGLPEREIRSILASANRRAEPRQIKHSHAPTSGYRQATSPPCHDHDEPRRPPAEEVLGVWESCTPTATNRRAVEFLLGRGIDPLKVDMLALARVLPNPARLPEWCWSWTRTHSLVVPAFDKRGGLVSLHARAVANAKPKTLWPKGYHVRGQVMADAAGRQLLQGNPVSRTLVLVEGLMDFLSFLMCYSDADSDAPAILGITSGCWTQALADRIPSGSEIVLAMDDDAAGRKYLAAVLRTIGARCLARRWIGARA